MTLLSLLSAVVSLNSAFYNITTASMSRRQAIIRLARSATATGIKN